MRIRVIGRGGRSFTLKAVKQSPVTLSVKTEEWMAGVWDIGSHESITDNAGTNYKPLLIMADETTLVRIGGHTDEKRI